MRIEIHRGFALPDECFELADWALDNVGGVLQQATMKAGHWRNRYTTRMCEQRISFPDSAYRLRNRIWRLLPKPGLLPLANGNGGMTVICHQPGSDTADHIDQSGHVGTDILRCNIIVKEPEAGGLLTVGGQRVTIGQGDLHCYVASRHRHSVSLVEGDRPRVIWLFSFRIDGDAWDAGRIPFRQQSHAA